MFKRAERVQELLRHEISTFLQTVTDPMIGFVTITGVKITDDLLDAKVFYSVFGTDEEKERTTHALRALIPKIRGHLGKHLESLYKAPNLFFVYDNTAEQAQRVSDLLKKLASERPAGVEPKPSEPETHDSPTENQTPKPDRRRRKKE